MPDQLTEISEEEARAAFIALREATITEVHPPGVDAARRALRRRRTVTSTAAGLAVAGVAVLGVATGAALTTGRTPAPLVPPAATDQNPVAAASTSTTDEKLYAVARDELTDPFETWMFPANPGTYRFMLYCSGTGGGRVILTAGSQSASAPVTCSDPPAASSVELTIATREKLVLRVDWDPGDGPARHPGGLGGQTARRLSRQVSARTRRAGATTRTASSAATRPASPPTPPDGRTA